MVLREQKSRKIGSRSPGMTVTIHQIRLFLIYWCVFWIPETFWILGFNFPEYHRNTYLTDCNFENLLCRVPGKEVILLFNCCRRMLESRKKKLFSEIIFAKKVVNVVTKWFCPGRRPAFRECRSLKFWTLMSHSFFLLSFWFSQRQKGTGSQVPRMFPQLFSVGFTVSHHAKTWNIKILSRMRILDLCRLRKVDPRGSEQISAWESLRVSLRPAAPAGHSSIDLISDTVTLHKIVALKVELSKLISSWWQDWEIWMFCLIWVSNWRFVWSLSLSFLASLHMSKHCDF